MIRIALLGIATVFIAMQFKSGRGEYGIMIGLACCILIFIFSMGKLDVIVEMIERIEGYISVNSQYVKVLLKVIGITYIAEFASDMCRDAGHAAVSNQIELAAKLSIMAVSIPIMLTLLETIEAFMG